MSGAQGLILHVKEKMGLKGNSFHVGYEYIIDHLKEKGF